MPGSNHCRAHGLFSTCSTWHHICMSQSPSLKSATLCKSNSLWEIISKRLLILCYTQKLVKSNQLLEKDKPSMQILLQRLSINANIMFVFYFNANSICFAQCMPSLCSLCWVAQVCSSCFLESETDFQGGKVTKSSSLKTTESKQVQWGSGKALLF